MAEGGWSIAMECGANHTVALFSSGAPPGAQLGEPSRCTPFELPFRAAQHAIDIHPSGGHAYAPFPATAARHAARAALHLRRGI